MNSLQALREARGAKAKEIRNLLDPSLYAYTTEIKTKVEGLYAETELFDSQIAQIERSLILSDDLTTEANELQSQIGGSTDQAAQKIQSAKKAFIKALRFGDTALSAEEKGLVSAASPANRGRVQNVAEGTATTGGYLVPTIVMPSLLIKLKYFGGMRLVANVLCNR